jgi:diamine N-acetyltransferase
MDATMASVTVRPVSAENEGEVLGLVVKPEQEQLVASNEASLRDARAYPSCKPFAIYAGETPVGFLMLRHDYPGPQDYYLLRLMIDASHQGQGYGRVAMQWLVEHVRTLPGARALRTSYDLGEGNAGAFYEKLGFAETGEVNDGEVELVLKL